MQTGIQTRLEITSIVELKRKTDPFFGPELKPIDKSLKVFSKFKEELRCENRNAILKEVYEINNGKAQSRYARALPKGYSLSKEIEEVYLIWGLDSPKILYSQETDEETLITFLGNLDEVAFDKNIGEINSTDFYKISGDGFDEYAILVADITLLDDPEGKPLFKKGGGTYTILKDRTAFEKILPSYVLRVELKKN
jgi:hypothetical protein